MRESPPPPELDAPKEKGGIGMTKEPLEKDRSLHHPDLSVLRTKALAKYLAAIFFNYTV